MPAMPAYNLPDYATVQPRQAAPARSPKRNLRVVPGTKSPALNDTWVMLIKVGLVCLLAFVLLGFVRVGVMTASYSVSSEATQLRQSITDVRSSNDSLSIQKSLATSPTNLRAAAAEDLGMSAPGKVKTMTLPADVVKTDSAGNLSLSLSVAEVAAQV